MNPLSALRRDLEAIDDDLIFTALQPGNEPVPLVLHEPGGTSHACGERVGQIHFEPDDLCRIAWIRKGIRRSAFCIRRPDQLLILSRCSRHGGYEKSNPEVSNDFHNFPNLQ